VGLTIFSPTYKAQDYTETTIQF